MRLFTKKAFSYAAAQLADLYIQNRSLDRANQIVEETLIKQPKYSKIWVVAAKLEMERNSWSSAQEKLEKAVEIDPENVMAYRLLADCSLKEKDFGAALDAQKMILFMHPDDLSALASIKKLESITAEDYDEDLFEAYSSKYAKEVADRTDLISIDSPEISDNEKQNSEQLERYLSLIDAFLVRNDIEKAQWTLQEALNELVPLMSSPPEKNFLINGLKSFSP